LMEAVMQIETGEIKIDEMKCRTQAGKFTREHFQQELSRAIHQTWISRGKKADLLPDGILEQIQGK
jgi:hypothetical protein